MNYNRNYCHVFTQNIDYDENEYYLPYVIFTNSNNFKYFLSFHKKNSVLKCDCDFMQSLKSNFCVATCTLWKFLHFHKKGIYLSRVIIKHLILYYENYIRFQYRCTMRKKWPPNLIEFSQTNYFITGISRKPFYVVQIHIEIHIGSIRKGREGKLSV